MAESEAERLKHKNESVFTDQLRRKSDEHQETLRRETEVVLQEMRKESDISAKGER